MCRLPTPLSAESPPDMPSFPKSRTVQSRAMALPGFPSPFPTPAGFPITGGSVGA